jgi:hypothetical protein
MAIGGGGMLCDPHRLTYRMDRGIAFQKCSLG